MNFTGTTGTLANLNGSVTYRIQVAVVVTIDGQEVTGDRSDANEMTTSEGGEQVCPGVCMYQHVIILVPTAPRNLMYTPPDVIGNMFDITLTWNRPDPPHGVIIWYYVSDIIKLLSLMMFLMSQVFYIRIGTDSQNYTLQTTDRDSSINSSHTWIGLIRGQYQFSVVAFNSKGPGDIDSVKVSTVPSKLII